MLILSSNLIPRLWDRRLSRVCPDSRVDEPYDFRFTDFPQRREARGRRFKLGRGMYGLFGAIRFLWNATRGHRLTPWRSEFLRWRVETYSGKPAESLRARDVFGFMWEQKWELLSFLFWTGDLEREARRRP